MNKIYSSLLFIVALSYSAFSQQDFTVNGLPIIPQSNYSNPGMFKPMGGYFGLPLISSVYTNFSNSGFTLAQIATHPGGKYGDSLVLNLDNVIGKLKKNEQINFNTSIDLFNLGFRIKKNYFMLSVRENINVQFQYSQDFLTFAWKGNAAFLGKDVDLSKMALNASHYREYALGYSREFGEKLSVGLRVKYLYGMENVTTSKNETTLFTDATSFALTAKSTMLINTSGLTNFDTISTDIPGYLFKRKNNGWGLDLGGEYKINDKFSVSASVLDLGQIIWNDVTNKSYYTENANFTFDGFKLNNIVNAPDSVDVVQQLGDTLNKVFKIKEKTEKYSSPLNSRFYVSGAYTPFKNTTVGLSFFGQFGKGYFKPAGAVSISQRLGNIFHVSANWSYMNRSASNIGFGFALNLGPIQIYTGADNVMAAFQPQNAKNVHAHVGLNLIFDYRKKKDDKAKDGEVDKKKKGKIKDRDADGIDDKDDKCPDVAGYVAFNGCPDKDNDGVQDSEDQCPDTAGIVENKGCPWPDSDKDGLIDREDSCITVAGPKENKGCPWKDSDGDGITDNTDGCLYVAGPAANNGCPYGDTDKDGVFDDKDKCPDKPGPIDNSGCPYGDRDGDGVKDNADGCPDVVGPVANNGCPFGDTDGDGVTDDVDKCPKTPGLAELQGCPKIEEKAQAVLDLAFKNLEFKTGTSTISQESFFSLYKLSELLKSKPDYRLQIDGHTDSQGVPAKNLELSKKRAEAVKTFLIGQGIGASRLKAEWYGSAKPIADNATPEGRDRNRRVEMKVIFE